MSLQAAVSAWGEPGQVGAVPAVRRPPTEAPALLPPPGLSAAALDTTPAPASHRTAVRSRRCCAQAQAAGALDRRGLGCVDITLQALGLWPDRMDGQMQAPHRPLLRPPRPGPGPGAPLGTIGDGVTPPPWPEGPSQPSSLLQPQAPQPSELGPLPPLPPDPGRCCLCSHHGPQPSGNPQQVPQPPIPTGTSGFLLPLLPCSPPLALTQFPSKATAPGTGVSPA